MPSNQATYFDAVSVHAIDDGVVVFEKDRQSLFVTNDASAPIWRHLGKTRSPRSTAIDLCERSGVEPDLARRQVAEALRAWRHDTLLAPPPAGADAAAGESLPVARRFLRKPNAMASVCRHHLLETSFTVRYATDGLRDAVEQALATIRPDARRPKFGAVIDVILFDDGIAVAEGDEVMRFCCSESQITDRVRTFMIERALTDCSERLAFRAAAVVRDGIGVMIPGTTDAGSNAIAAGLVSEGFELACSEIAVLGRRGSAIYPSPFGLGIAERDMRGLAVRFPALASCRHHTRADGARERYLPLHDHQVVQSDTEIAMKYLVFPERREGAGLDAVPMSDVAAIKRLLPGLVPCGGTLQSEDIDRAVEWVGGPRCFALRYSSLTDAVNLLGQMSGCGAGRQVA